MLQDTQDLIFIRAFNCVDANADIRTKEGRGNNVGDAVLECCQRKKKKLIYPKQLPFQSREI